LKKTITNCLCSDNEAQKESSEWYKITGQMKMQFTADKSSQP